MQQNKQENRCTAGCCHYDENGNKTGMCGLNDCNHPHCHTLSTPEKKGFSSFGSPEYVETDSITNHTPSTSEEVDEWPVANAKEGFDEALDNFANSIKHSENTDIEEWEKLTISVPSSRDGKPCSYTLDQMFNDFELGNAIALDTNLPSERHREAIEWLRRYVKSFIHQALLKAEQKGKEQAPIEHCSEPNCPECDLAAYNRGREAERRELREKVEKIKYKVDDRNITDEEKELMEKIYPGWATRNWGSFVALHEVLSLLSDKE